MVLTEGQARVQEGQAPVHGIGVQEGQAPVQEGQAPVHGIAGISHYHQVAGSHPRGQVIPEGFERVELLTGGRGWVEHEGTWQELTAGSLVWQMPGDETIARSDHADPYHCLSINFEVGRMEGRRVRRVTRWSDPFAVKAFTGELVDLWIRKLVLPEVLTGYAFGRLYIQACMSQRRLEEGGLPRALQLAQELIGKAYGESLPVSRLAEAAGCSGPHLHDLYRTHLKGSPHQMVMEKRLQEACRRLASTPDPIKRIALEVGFSTPAAFSHAFRRYAGMTPGAYRRRSQQAG